MAFSNNTTSVIGTNLDGTGERDEIGIRNAWCARWFYNRSLLDEKYVRVNGLVSGMWANAVRDLTTRGPIHLGDPAKSYAGMPVSSATTFNWSTPGNTGGFTLPAHGGVALFFGVNDLSHMPDLSGCAYLATGEPQYLDLQMEWANEAIFGNITPLRNGTVGGVNYYGVTTYGTQNLFRMPAWGLRAQVDADAWWPDRDPAGTATGTYLHDQARASTHLPTVSIPLETSWAATNCYWRFPGGSSRGPWNFFYMVNVLIDAASNNEEADAKSLLNCTATWLNHAYGAFNGDYSLWATAEAPYDLGKDDGGPFILANLSWAAGIATITLPSEGNLFTGEVMNVQGVGYNGVYTITRTGPTTATFPLVADPGGPAVGQLNAVAQLVTSDAMFSSLYGVAPPTSIIYLAWNSGTPGSVAQVFTDYSAYGSFTPGGQSWQPANGDKYIFPPYYGGSPFTLPPGGLVVSQPYYIVNTHAGPISGMSWASGTLTM